MREQKVEPRLPPTRLDLTRVADQWIHAGRRRHEIKGSQIEVVVEPFIKIPSGRRSRSRTTGCIFRPQAKPSLEERAQVADYGKPEVSQAEVGSREVGSGCVGASSPTGCNI